MKLRLLALACLATLVACDDSGSPFFYAPDAVALADADAANGLDTPSADVVEDTASDTGPGDTAEPDAEPDVPDADAPDDVPGPDVPEADVPEPDVAEPDVPEPDVEPDSDPGPACGDDFFDGQAHESPDAPDWSSDGGSRAEAPYPRSYDSGLNAIIAAAPFDRDPTDVESPLPNEIEVEVIEATVFATAPNTGDFTGAQRSFWLHDGRGAIQVFLSEEFPEFWPPFDVHVGQRISFVATVVGSYHGVPQIYEASGWRVASGGNPVAFWEIGDDAIGFEDVPRNVRMTGEIVSAFGPCGGSSSCYEFVYNGQTITFRTAADWIDVGDCVAWAGPVGTFGGLPQLDGSNFRWFYNYGRTP